MKLAVEVLSKRRVRITETIEFDQKHKNDLEQALQEVTSRLSVSFEELEQINRAIDTLMAEENAKMEKIREAIDMKVEEIDKIDQEIDDTMLRLKEEFGKKLAALNDSAH